METYLQDQGHQLTSSHLYNRQDFPSVDDIDWLIVMGGPMGVYEEAKYKWLKREKKFIKNAMDKGKTVLGICLGAQLIADVLGAQIVKNKHREIGWFPVVRNDAVAQTILNGVFPKSLLVFHWHGDRFEIPAGAISLASSEACKQQGFIFDNRIIALQFHLETTQETAKLLIKNCRSELDGSHYVQTESAMLAEPGRFDHINDIMRLVLQKLEKTAINRA